MTVSELIQKLELHNPDARVVIHIPYSDSDQEINDYICGDDEEVYLTPNPV